jgi:hypothetical protein
LESVVVELERGHFVVVGKCCLLHRVFFKGEALESEGVSFECVGREYGGSALIFLRQYSSWRGGEFRVVT